MKKIKFLMKNRLTSYLTTSIGAIMLSSSNLTSAPIVAIYDIESPVSETGQSSDSLSGLLSMGDPSRPLTHFDIIRSLQSAAIDDEVKAVVLDVDSSGLSLAQTQEIRDHLLSIRSAGKDVWLYTEYLSTTTALLGSAANHMTLMPAGNVMLTGLYGENMYFKKLLDKVGVKVEVIHIGDFKSAGETFYRDSPSDHAAEQQAILLDSLFEQIISQIAEGRGISVEQMKEIIDLGHISPQQALAFKLVDHLDYRTDFIAKIRAQYSDKAKFDRTYQLPDLNGPEINGIFDLVKVMLNRGNNDKFTSPYIAVIPLEGDITDASIAPVRSEILKAARNKNCKALVLRVNSPGDSALANDVLWEATDTFKATGRPFVVSMGAVAASGGYYVAAGADHIFAEPGTITGSIGVVGMKFVIGNALDKLGINVHSSKRGKHADLMNSTRGYTPEEAKIIRDSMLEVYGVFKQRITDGRGDRIKGDLEKLAGGRVYSGKDALSIGLVDELGGLNQAINHAISLAKLDQVKVHLLPEPKSAIDGIFVPPARDTHEFIQASRPHSPALQIRQQLLNSQTLGLLGSHKLRQIDSFLNQLESFQNQRILLIAPSINVR
jgi:protease-4